MIIINYYYVDYDTRNSKFNNMDTTQCIMIYIIAFAQIEIGKNQKSNHKFSNDTIIMWTKVMTKRTIFILHSFILI